jgi:hypothetical protein
MNIGNIVRGLAAGSMLVLVTVGVPATQVHAQPNDDEGIEMDCPLSGHWVVNGGYVIAKDSQGRYHRVYCVNGSWVDGGPILSYLTTQGISTSVSGVLAR